jgi:hypothetical protein
LYSLLHRYLPHFDIIRVPGRMIYLVYFALAMSIPIALQRVTDRLQNTWPAVSRPVSLAAVAIVAGLVAEPILRAPGVLLSGVLDRGQLAALRDVIPADEPVLLLPVYPAGSSQGALAEHFIVASQRATINGYAPNAPRQAYELLNELTSLNQGSLSSEAHRQLWELGVRHVVHLEGVSFLRPAGTRRAYLDSLARKGILDISAKTREYQLFKLRPAADSATAVASEASEASQTLVAPGR